MFALLQNHPLILMEAAVVEQLRRHPAVNLHPELENALLIYDDSAVTILQELYQSYLDVAIESHLPFVLLTPTWRANKERISKAGITADVNTDNVRFIKNIIEKQSSDIPIKIGGLIGCKNDCYKPEEGLTAYEAEAFHNWQLTKLAKAGVDFLICETLPYVPEAIGIARAMKKQKVPFIISFVIDRTGCVLDGTPIAEAVAQLDQATNKAPLGYMINCAYPTFLCADQQPSSLFDRLIGIQANASSLDHCDLDNSKNIQLDDIEDWGKEMIRLNKQFGIKILGGCCGTGRNHLEYLTY